MGVVCFVCVFVCVRELKKEKRVVVCLCVKENKLKKKKTIYIYKVFRNRVCSSHRLIFFCFWCCVVVF